MKRKEHIVCMIGFLLSVGFTMKAMAIHSEDLSRASIVYRADATGNGEKNAPAVLVNEIKKRTGIELCVTSKWETGRPLIVLSSQVSSAWGRELPKREGESLPENQPEGFRIWLDRSGGFPVVWVIAKESRASLFAVGKLLRTLTMKNGELTIPIGTDIATSPRYPIRGHQLGYRNTDNCYDAWTKEQYEQYILELAFFGVNTIENTPFHDPDSKVYKYPREEMNLYIGDICDKYELRHSLWIPAHIDLNEEKSREEFWGKHVSLIGKLKRLDALFIAGGDPGDNHPQFVLPWMERVYRLASKRFPHVQMWLSQQGYDKHKQEYVYNYLRTQAPRWLTGLVNGPGSPNPDEERRQLPGRYAYRFYPDITHNIRSQYPISWWDQALAITLGREATNPRMEEYAYIFDWIMPWGEGFVTYSEGIHDDMNKILFSGKAWDPTLSIYNITREYARLFFSNDLEILGGDAIMALENNWRGTLINNGAVSGTLLMWETMGRSHPELKKNWRFQQYLLRAVYDYYVRERQIIEAALEKEAYNILLTAEDIGSDQAAKKALGILKQVEVDRPLPLLRQQIIDLCEALWQSIGLQTSAIKYFARDSQRGAILDFIDLPLNNRWWIEDELAKMEKMDDENKKIEFLKRIALWETPGEGSYYNDLGNRAKSDNMVHSDFVYTQLRTMENPQPRYWAHDKGFSRQRLSSLTSVEGATMIYPHVNQESDYVIRYTGKGTIFVSINGQPVHTSESDKPLLPNNVIEIPVDRKFLGEGELKVSFSHPDESALNWRNHSYITETWLIKKKK